MSNNLLESIKRIVVSRGFELQAHITEMKCSNMFNMLTGNPIENPFQLTSLFYLGYLKNKNESSEKKGTSEL